MQGHQLGACFSSAGVEHRRQSEWRRHLLLRRLLLRGRVRLLGCSAAIGRAAGLWQRGGSRGHLQAAAQLLQRLQMVGLLVAQAAALPPPLLGRHALAVAAKRAEGQDGELGGVLNRV